MKKKFLGRVEIRKVGSYKKLERLLDKKGLLEGILETSSKSFGGAVWLIKKDDQEYVALSSYSRKVKARKDGRNYYFYRYYLINPEKLDELLNLFYDD
jgi:hypothetical protein